MTQSLLIRNNKGQFIKGFKQPREYIEKNRTAHLGKKPSEETKRKNRENGSKYWLGKPGNQRGAQHWNWRGGISKPNNAFRNSFEYRQWRIKVFERDDFTCQICGVRGGKIHADHIKPFAFYHELRLELSNGRTLCVPCHKKTPTYQNRWYYKQQKKSPNTMLY